MLARSANGGGATRARRCPEGSSGSQRQLGGAPPPDRMTASSRRTRWTPCPSLGSDPIALKTRSAPPASVRSYRQVFVSTRKKVRFKYNRVSVFCAFYLRRCEVNLVLCVPGRAQSGSVGRVGIAENGRKPLKTAKSRLPTLFCWSKRVGRSGFPAQKFLRRASRGGSVGRSGRVGSSKILKRWSVGGGRSAYI